MLVADSGAQRVHVVEIHFGAGIESGPGEERLAPVEHRVVLPETPDVAQSRDEWAMLAVPMLLEFVDVESGAARRQHDSRDHRAAVSSFIAAVPASESC
jgi:hypothetical protein